MQLVGNTILITGGSEGIGLELAGRLAPQNNVIICGRTKQKLARAKAAIPDITTMICDVTVAEQRQGLIKKIISDHPDLNVLINNAGGRHLVDLTTAENPEGALSADLDLNFIAPVCLCNTILPHLKTKSQAAIVNISTGLIYLPKVSSPFYCAAKSALHSYTKSLRWSLRNVPIHISEVFLPLVATHFHQGNLPDTIPAISAENAVDRMLPGLNKGKQEIHIGKSTLARWLACINYDRGMGIINK